jgi:hypothetical protein
MTFARLASALALTVMLVPAPAHADDPNDPGMRSPAARARDREVIRRLNREELARTSARDAGYAEGWRAYREAPLRSSEYEAAMAEWRRAVKLCQSGRYEYCAR